MLLIRRSLFCILCTALLFLTAACGSDAPAPAAESRPVGDQQFTPPPMLTAAFDESAAQGDSGVELDTSHLSDGYAALRVNLEGKLKCMVTYEGEITGALPHQYTYLVPGDGTPVIIPLQMGSGVYEFAVYKNISDDKYACVYRQSETVTLGDEFQPFLRPSIYVDYSQDSACVKKAAQLTADAVDAVDAAARIYDYIVDTVQYDTVKADTVGSDYFADPDETLSTARGICVDYAALAAAMLRSQGIPAKVITGYVAPNNLYHAWNMIWFEETGWVTVSFEVNGNNWNRVDPTFAAGGADPAYIGNAENYTDFRTY